MKCGFSSCKRAVFCRGRHICNEHWARVSMDTRWQIYLWDRLQHRGRLIASLRLAEARQTPGAK